MTRAEIVRASHDFRVTRRIHALLAAALLWGLPGPSAGNEAPRPTEAAPACSRSVAAPVAAAVVIAKDATAGDLALQAEQSFARGDTSDAAALWSEAAARFGQAGKPGAQADAWLRAAQARAADGYLADAESMLDAALRQAGVDPARSASLQAALARVQFDAGQVSLAARTSEDALSAARESGAPRARAAAASVRGDVLRAQGDRAAALAVYETARADAEQAHDALLAAQIEAIAARTAQEDGAPDAAARLESALAHASALPASDAKAQLLLYLGGSYEHLADAQAPALRARAAEAYTRAGQAAASAGARRSLAFAQGGLGALAEQDARFDDALRLTREALRSAQAADAPDALYRFEAQQARILRAQGDPAGARDAYRRALRTLDGSLGSGRGLEFDRAVLPVYLGLVDLLLQEAHATDDAAKRRGLLIEARGRVEDLKTGELTDHFHDACLMEQRHALPETVGASLVIYPIILPERTELLVSRGDELSSVVVPIDASTLDAKVLELRQSLQKRTRRDYLRQAAELYDWLIRPLEPELAHGPIDALVFVPAGSLRTIPMSALYDSQTKQFLIERFPVAIIPALSLTDPRAIEQRHVRTLMAGLTLPVRGYAALANVGSELSAVNEIFGGKSLIDQRFVTSAIEDALANESFNVVHIASHGEFLADSSNSFVLTYDGELELDHLAALVEKRRFGGEPLELLTLSACETAAGDDRAALGLAGVAIRAGARSAIATLWTVNDEAASTLIADFYRELAGGASRAEALRRAQISLLRSRPYRHPGYWAPFVLISNWL